MAFMNSSLETVKFLGISLKSIAYNTFYNNNLSGILTLPSGLTSIASGAFGGNILDKIVLPSSVTSITETSFASNLNVYAEKDDFSFAFSTSASNVFKIYSGISETNVSGKWHYVGDEPVAWGESFTISYVSGSYTTVQNPTSYTHGTAKTLMEPTKSGYVFGGWIDQNGNVRNIISAECAGNLTLTASFGTYGLKLRTNSVDINGGKELLSYNGSSTTLDIPEGVIFIGDSRSITPSITALKLPKTLEHIGSKAFYGCSKLKSLSIQKNVNYIGSQAFNSTSLTTLSVAYDNKYYGIDNYSLYNRTTKQLMMATNKTSLISSSIKSIADYAFFGLKELKSINIPSNVNDIGAYAFAYSGLEKVTFSSYVDGITIRKYAFYNCSSLTEVELPLGLTTVSEYSFAICSNLTKLSIPATVESIETKAFYSSKITKLNFPTVLSSLNATAFADNPYLTSINVDASNKTYTSVRNGKEINGVATVSQTNPELILGCSNTDISSIRIIGAYALNQVHGKFVIPTTVEFIRENAFTGVSSNELKIYSVSSSDQSGWDAGWYSNATVYYGISETEASGMWHYVDEQPVGWGESFKITYDLSSGGSLISSHITSYVHSSSPTAVQEAVRSDYSFGAWLDQNGNIRNIIPAGTAGDLILTPTWGSAGLSMRGNPDSPVGAKILLGVGSCSDTAIKIPFGVDKIDQSAFSGNTNIVSVYIPNSVETMLSGAFYNCTSLTTVIFQEGCKIQVLDEGVFAGCSSLKSFTIPSSVTTLNLQCLAATGLTKITLPSTLKTVGSLAFDNCQYLKTIIIEKGVEVISFNAFDSVLDAGFYLMASSVPSGFENREDEGLTNWNNGNTYYFYSETKPTTAGYYWRYVSGVPTPWPVPYEIAFDANKPSNASSSVTGTAPSNVLENTGSNVTMPANPFTLRGWTFVSWNTKADGTGRSFEAGKTATKPDLATSGVATLYAIWKPWTYTVTFMTVGPNATHPNVGTAQTITVSYDSGTTLPVIDRELNGYTFIGWTYSNYTYVVGDKIDNFASADGQSFGLLPKWEAKSYTIKFVLDGFVLSNKTHDIDGSLPADIIAKYDSNVTLPAPSFTLFGWKFIQYKCSAGTFSSGTSVAWGYDDAPDGVMTVTIVMTQYTYTISYNSNKPSKASGTIVGSGVSTSAIYDSNVYIGISNYSLTGWTFVNWNTKADGTGTSYSAGVTVAKPNILNNDGTISAGGTLYAIWRANTYTIVFDKNQPSDASHTVTGSMDSITVNYDDYITLPACGFSLFGWGASSVKITSKVDSTTKSLSFNATSTTVRNLTTVDGDTLTAKVVWSKTGTAFNINANGGTYSGTTSFWAYYDTWYSIGKPTRTGYIFTGWTFATMYGDEHYFGSSTSNFITTSETSYTTPAWSTTYFKNLHIASGLFATANWTPITYYIQYNNVGSATSTGTNPTVVKYDQEITVYPYSRLGYHFSGFNISGMDSTTHVIGSGTSTETTLYYVTDTLFKNLTSVDGATITFDALLFQNTFKVVYDYDGGALSSGSTNTTAMLYDATYNLVSPGKAGYIFSGWLITGMSTNDTHYFYLSEATTADYSSSNASYTFSTAYAKNKVKNLHNEEGATVTFTAIWTPITYKLTYDLNGGTIGTVPPPSATYDAYFMVAEPTRVGYTFTGWYVGGMDSTTHYFGSSTNSNTYAINVYDSSFKNLTSVNGATISFIAGWEPNTYNITYDYAGGYLDGTNPRYAIEYDATVYITSPTRTGYNFIGWYIEGMASGVTHYYSENGTLTNYITNDNEKFMFSTASKNTTYKCLHDTNGATVTFTACWTNIQYNLTFNLAGGTATGDLPADALYDVGFTVENPTRLGYTFIGWSITGMDAGTHYFDSDSLSGTTASGIMATRFENLTSVDGATISFTATWRANTYTISYNYVNATTTPSNPTSATYDSWFTVDYPTRRGYTFVGYDISGMTADEHLYGSRKTSYHTTSAPSLRVNGTTNKYFENLRSTSGTVTFKAVWEANKYNVTYVYIARNTYDNTYANYGVKNGVHPYATSTQKAVATYDATFTLGVTLSYAETCPAGMQVAGWYMTTVAPSTISVGKISTTHGLNASFTWNEIADQYFYAIYEPKQYTVEFYGLANNATNYASNLVVDRYTKFDTKTATTGQTFSHDVHSFNGYTQTHWIYSATKLNDMLSLSTTNFDVSYVKSGFAWNIDINDTVYFYAYYEANEYTITFYTTFNNTIGMVNNTASYSKLNNINAGRISVKFNSSVDLFSILSTTAEQTVPNGYKFVGWYFFDANEDTNLTLSGSGTHGIKINTYDSIGNKTVYCNPLSGTVAHYGYNGDVNAYAYYTPKNYFIEFHFPSDDTIVQTAARLGYDINSNIDFRLILNACKTYNGSHKIGYSFNTTYTVNDIKYVGTGHSLLGTNFLGWSVLTNQAPYDTSSDKVFTKYDINWYVGDNIQVREYNENEGATVYHAYAVYELAIYKIHYYVAKDYDSTNKLNTSNYISNSNYPISSDVFLGDSILILAYDDTTDEFKALNFFDKGMHIGGWYITSSKFSSSQFGTTLKLTEELIQSHGERAGETINISPSRPWFDDNLKPDDDGCYHYQAFAWYSWTKYAVNYYEISNENFNYDSVVNNFFGSFVNGNSNYSFMTTEYATFESYNSSPSETYTLLSGPTKIPYGYSFVRWQLFVSDDNGNMIETTIDSTTGWHYTNSIYCYAVYEENSYNVNYYIAKNNKIDYSFFYSNYYLSTTESIVFNAKFRVKEFSLIGYNVLGYYVCASNAVADDSNKSITIVKNFTFDLDAIAGSLYTESELVQNFTVGKEFKFRYANDINVYAIYEQKEFDISYFIPTTNTVAGMTKDFAEVHSDKVKFNANYNVWTSAAFMNVTGYNFAGWYVSTKPHTTGAITGITNEYCKSLQVNIASSETGGLAAGTYKDNLLSNSSAYNQNWVKDASFVYRYAESVYAYACFTAKTYKVYYYDVNGNNNGLVNNALNYSSRGDTNGVEYTFNSSMIVTEGILSRYNNYSFALKGYNFRGFYISSSKLSSQTFTSQTSAYNDSYWIYGNSSSGLSDSRVESNGYLQNWSDGNTFYFRYTGDIYAYAVYDHATYEVNYYGPMNNAVGYANRIDRYALLSGLDTIYTDVAFNGSYRVLNYQIDGYELAGWKVFTTLQSTGEIDSYTNEYLLSYVQSNSSNVKTNSSDEEFGNSYKQTWLPDSTFTWRYSTDVYAYAFYKVKTYNVHFYEPQDNLVEYNAGLQNIEHVRYSHFFVETLVRQVSFNNLFEVRTNDSIAGYTFKGWYVSKSMLDDSSMTKTQISGYTSDVYLNNDISFGDEMYRQKWGSDATNFYFRYSSDLYLYAYMTANSYYIKYYDTDSNMFRHANYADKYLEKYSSQILFNQNMTTYRLGANQDNIIDGYMWTYWIVSTTPLTSVLSTTTDYTFFNSYSRHGSSSYETVSDELISENKNTYAFYGKIPSNEFIFRATSDLYVYAFYREFEYNIHVYAPNSNMVGDVNKASTYKNVADILNVKFNYKMLISDALTGRISLTISDYDNNQFNLFTFLKVPGYTFEGFKASQTQITSGTIDDV